jgi:hypothetical protein
MKSSSSATINLFLSSDLAMTMITPTLMITGSKEERQQQMAALLARKVEEAKKKTWKLKFGGKEIPVKEVVESVVGIISWADDYISGALSTNPYASVAWGGVSLLLPVSPNTWKPLHQCLVTVDSSLAFLHIPTMYNLLTQIRSWL